MTEAFSFEDRQTRPSEIPEVDGPPTPQAASTVRPKVAAPPLMGRAPRPSAVRIRKPVVQAMVGGAALLLSGSLAWAFIVQPDLKAKARDAADAERLEETRGGVRPSDRVRSCASGTFVSPSRPITRDRTGSPGSAGSRRSPRRRTTSSQSSTATWR